MEILLINGPNLNLLGNRENSIYGNDTLEDIEKNLSKICEDNGVSFASFQSNAEHELIDWIHEAREEAFGLIINPAAFSHTSIAILDALTLFEGPIIEVHISNIHKRETFRHQSYVSQKATAVIAGFGTEGYNIALKKMMQLWAKTK